MFLHDSLMLFDQAGGMKKEDKLLYRVELLKFVGAAKTMGAALAGIDYTQEHNAYLERFVVALLESVVHWVLLALCIWGLHCHVVICLCATVQLRYVGT
jgi:hypothetical protein